MRTIAHWEAAHRNVIADEPQLQSTINNELLYGLALAEDDQILNGDGQTERYVERKSEFGGDIARAWFLKVCLGNRTAA